MPKSDAVWGIDIGSCSLKAIRCRPGNRETQLVADAFDYIEYPQILTQPGANAEELVAEALSQFLSRNPVRGDRVAIAVPGHSGLVRFITLPPVETKRIPDLVRFETKQQIPFDLDEVVWDYHQMSGGMVEEGFALDTEIGLFAMKREQVDRSLEPFQKAAVEVDLVQLAPVALYNYLVFDQMPDLPPPDEFDPENPPPSVVVLSMGTEATDLVVSNGFRVRQRSIPLGGNHFTKALTKELKLTFAKAEHLKRNATSAPDPKAVFQAMRPVFNDLLTEIQRSIRYFNTLDRKMQIEKVLALGNATKLPGLTRYLAQNLGCEVVRVEQFRSLAGSEVKDAPAFKQNLPAFAVCYGLALQGLGKGTIQTNLIPREIIRDRVIREKKPWAVAAAALLLLGCAISFVSFSRALGTVDEATFGPVEQKLEDVKQRADGFQNQVTTLQSDFDRLKQIGNNLVLNITGRRQWLELLKVINDCLPRDRPGQVPEKIEERRELHITSIECQRTDNLEKWYAWVKKNVEQKHGYMGKPPEEETAQADAAIGAPATDPSGGMGTADAAAGTSSAFGGGGAVEEAPISGEGWVIRLTGYHYHNRTQARGREADLYGNQYVIRTLIENLCSKPIMLGDPPQKYLPHELGIYYPSLINPQRVQIVRVRNPKASGTAGTTAYAGAGYGGGMQGYGSYGMMGEDEEGMDMMANGMMGGGGMTASATGPSGPVRAGAEESDEPAEIELPRLDFVVEFAWKPVIPGQEEEEQEEAGATVPFAPNMSAP
ncbi:MAG TPA: type IV pilus assembly protein PilM [Planctomycetes bacterium]|nr:type IV pilus assembly protein PilM [Planctomycetota bacterium]